jgi:4-amino-4-deoxy-L-arabinose transferase-like glycosyltransferase
MIRVVLLFVTAAAALALMGGGVRLGGDSGVYVSGAHALIAGEALTARQPSYVGYIAVVAACEWIGLGPAGVIALQIAVAALAIVAVYHMAGALGGDAAALSASLLVAIDFDTARWHTYLLTDSLFLSLLTISIALVWRAATLRRPQWYVRAGVAVLITALVRPEGWFLLPAAAAYWAVAGTAGRQRWWRLAGTAVAVTALLLMVAPRLRGNLEAVAPWQMLESGQTIWEYDGWRLRMPVEAEPLGTGAQSAVRYAFRHPLETASLMAARVVVHVVHVRPYYSTIHNAAIVIWWLPIYLLAGHAAWRYRHAALTQWCLVAVATQTLVVALTHADWDGRYLSHVAPIINVFAGCTLAALIRRVRASSGLVDAV